LCSPSFLLLCVLDAKSVRRVASQIRQDEEVFGGLLGPLAHLAATGWLLAA
jgi:hypothetical protein